MRRRRRLELVMIDPDVGLVLRGLASLADLSHAVDSRDRYRIELANRRAKRTLAALVAR